MRTVSVFDAEMVFGVCHPMILGITGAFGSGKSSALHYFTSRSWHTFDADAVCRSFYEAKHPGLFAAVRENFGNVFTSNGDIDRQKLGTEVFANPEKIAILTGILYPLLTEKLVAEIEFCRQKKINGAFELPLLYEAGFEKYFDAVLTIWVPPQLSRIRLYGRNFSDEEITRRTAMQLPAGIKLERADFAVINTGSERDMTDQLDKMFSNF